VVHEAVATYRCEMDYSRAEVAVAGKKRLTEKEKIGYSRAEIAAAARK
jgi:hypothetical protein